jgi:pre-mRNA-processing factor 39
VPNSLTLLCLPRLFEEFWERYIRWLEKNGYIDEAMGALQRATITFCRNRPEIHIFAMHFDERHGNIESGRARYKLVLGELSPRLLSATVAAANFERRQVSRWLQHMCGSVGGYNICVGQ